MHIKSRMRFFGALMLFLAAGLSLGCASYLPEIRGTVVDDATGAPIEGAVVLVEWSRMAGGFEQSMKTAGVYEVQTGTDGGFMVPSISKFSHMIFVIYKGGYVAWRSEHLFTSGTGFKPRTDFKWQDGNLYRLERFKDGMSYIAHGSFVDDAARVSGGLFRKTFDEEELDKRVRERAGRRAERDAREAEEKRKAGGGQQ